MNSPAPPAGDDVAAEAPAATHREIRTVYLGLMIVMALSAIDQSIVATALPRILSDLGGVAHLSWVVTAYVLATTATMPLYGKLSDQYGRKPMLYTAVGLFLLGSVLSGLAQSMPQLIAFRAVQGMGAGGLLPLAQIIVADLVPPRQRGRYQGWIGAVFALCSVLGPVIGGVITDALSWHWIFFINVPIALAALALGRRLLTRDRGLGLSEGVDSGGAVLITAALMVGVYGIVGAADHGWTSPRTLALLGASLAMIGAFGAWEARVRNPILPLRLLRLRSLIDASVVRSFVAVGMYTAFFFGTLYLQNVLGFGPVATGFAFLPMTLTVAALSSGIVAALVRRFGPLPILFGGLASMVAGLLLLAAQSADAGYAPQTLIALLLMGVGAGSSMMPLLTLAMAEVPRADAGIASGIVNVTMQVAAALGLAVFGTLSADHTQALRAAGHAAGDALLSGYHLAMLSAAGVVVVGIVLAAAALRPRRAPALATLEEEAIAER